MAEFRALDPISIFGNVFGLAGPLHPDGLGLQSRRIPHGLTANIAFTPKYQAFPGIVQGGVIGTAFECHGNWTAAIHLMDMSCLPRPPLTLTASILVGIRKKGIDRPGKMMN